MVQDAATATVTLKQGSHMTDAPQKGIRHRLFRNAVLIFFIAFPIVTGSMASQERMTAGIFGGIGKAEKHITWHDIKEVTKTEDRLFTLGVLFEYGLSETFSLVLTPQFSEVNGGWTHYFYRPEDEELPAVDYGVPSLYALELPVAVRAGMRYGIFRPYLAAGVLLGVAYDERAYKATSWWDDDMRHCFMQYEKVSGMYFAVQGGAGVTVDLFANTAVWLDASLFQHLSEPIDTETVTWDAPARWLFRFGFVFELAGGAE